MDLTDFIGSLTSGSKEEKQKSRRGRKDSSIKDDNKTEDYSKEKEFARLLDRDFDPRKPLMLG